METPYLQYNVVLDTLYKAIELIFPVFPIDISLSEKLDVLEFNCKLGMFLGKTFHRG